MKSKPIFTGFCIAFFGACGINRGNNYPTLVNGTYPLNSCVILKRGEGRRFAFFRVRYLFSAYHYSEEKTAEIKVLRSDIQVIKRSSASGLGDFMIVGYDGSVHLRVIEGFCKQPA